ncbi:MAG: hypothetical protein WC976_06545 [Caldisericia bacterium]
MNTRFLKALFIIKNEQIRRVQTVPVEIYEVGENKRRVVYNPATEELKCSCPDTPKEKGIVCCKHRYAFFIYTQRCPFGKTADAYHDWVFEQVMSIMEGLVAEAEELKLKKPRKDKEQVLPVINKKKKTRVMF